MYDLTTRIDFQTYMEEFRKLNSSQMQERIQQVDNDLLKPVMDTFQNIIWERGLKQIESILGRKDFVGEYEGIHFYGGELCGRVGVTVRQPETKTLVSFISYDINMMKTQNPMDVRPFAFAQFDGTPLDMIAMITKLAQHFERTVNKSELLTPSPEVKNGGALECDREIVR